MFTPRTQLNHPLRNTRVFRKEGLCLDRNGSIYSLFSPSLLWKPASCGVSHNVRDTEEPRGNSHHRGDTSRRAPHTHTHTHPTHTPHTHTHPTHTHQHTHTTHTRSGQTVLSFFLPSSITEELSRSCRILLLQPEANNSAGESRSEGREEERHTTQKRDSWRGCYK